MQLFINIRLLLHGKSSAEYKNVNLIDVTLILLDIIIMWITNPETSIAGE